MKLLYAFSLYNNNFGSNSKSYHEGEDYSAAQVQRAVWQGEALKAEILLVSKLQIMLPLFLITPHSFLLFHRISLILLFHRICETFEEILENNNCPGVEWGKQKKKKKTESKEKGRQFCSD